MDEPGPHDDLDRLAGRVIGAGRGGGPGALPSPGLCTVALRLAAALDAYERDGGTAHRDDVLTMEEFRGVVVYRRCKTALPRPQGRWEIALSDGSDHEWVIGEAGGRWVVEGLERLTGGTMRGHQVGVDDTGSDAAPPSARRGVRRRSALGWYPDPEAGHDLRFFDGTTWTRFVIDAASDGS